MEINFKNKNETKRVMRSGVINKRKELRLDHELSVLNPVPTYKSTTEETKDT